MKKDPFESIDLNSPIYIYGAGIVGSTAKTVLEENGFNNIKAFIDTFKSGELNGIPIMRFSDYVTDHKNGNIIFIASMHYKEIQKELKSNGIAFFCFGTYVMEIKASLTSQRLLKLANDMIISLEIFPYRDVPAVKHSPDKYSFTMIVWGDEYIKMMIDHTLPSMLSPNNFPMLKQKPGSRFCLFTPEKEATQFKSSKVFKLLQEYMDVHIYYIKPPAPTITDSDNEQEKYDLHNSFHIYALREAEKENFVVGFINPDWILSDGSIAHAIEAVEKGFRLVLTPDLIVEKNRFLSAWRDSSISSNLIEKGVSARSLVKIGISTLHQRTKVDFVDAQPYNKRPCRFYWSIDKGGILERAFHMHTFIIWPMVKSRSFFDSVGHDFIYRAVPDPSKVYIVKNSDDGFHLNIQPEEDAHSVVPGFDLRIVSNWAGEVTNTYLRNLLHTTIRIHTGSCSGKEWDRIELESDELVKSIFPLVDCETKAG